MKFYYFHLMPYVMDHDEPSSWVTLSNRLYDPKLGHTLYNQYLDQLEYAERLGWDGLCVNEHHQNCYGTMPSPNVMAAMLARANPPKLPSELSFEEADRDGYIIYGSPSTVRDKLRIFSDELQAGILCSGMNGGSHEATLEMMQLFADEVMPHFREDVHVDETAGVGR